MHKTLEIEIYVLCVFMENPKRNAGILAHKKLGYLS